jgi:hypothetical protein
MPYGVLEAGRQGSFIHMLRVVLNDEPLSGALRDVYVRQ